MEKIIAFSIAGFTLVTTKVSDLVKVVLACIILTCISSFQDLFSLFLDISRAIRFMFYLPHYTIANVGANAGVDDGLGCGENQNNKGLFGEEIIEEVVRRLMSTRSDEYLEEELLDLFDESEPSFEEIKETFDFFDENGDGYIDEKDLEKFLSKLGFSYEFSRKDCRGMIQAFDDNKDGRIDFDEFLKLMEHSFD